MLVHYILIQRFYVYKKFTIKTIYSCSIIFCNV